MTEILDQNELDALLLAVSTGNIDAEDYSMAGEQKKVMIYDFRRPDRFTQGQIRTMQMIHETFARLTTTALSAQLRALVSVHVASVDQLTYEEFIRSIPNPTTLNVINMDTLKGSAVLEIDPSITFTIIDMLFGGMGEAAKIYRELTDIELSVMEGIIVRMLGLLREAWSNVIDLRPRLNIIETNPQFAQIVPPDEMILLITFETKIGEVEGMMNLCVPYPVIEPIIDKLSPQYYYPEAGNDRGLQYNIKEKAFFDEYPVFTGVFDNMTIDELRKLKSGTRIPLKDSTAVKKVYRYSGLNKEVENG